MAKIVELRAEQFKRLKVVQLKVDGRNLVVLNGRNGSGKTSALDAIWAALGGKAAGPLEPVRRGQKKASATVTLDDGLVVEATWTAKGGRQITVTGSDGTPLRRPQAILDALCSERTVDPLAFSGLDGRKQTEVLRSLVGLDFSAEDARRARLYEQRSDTNREIKRALARLGTMPPRDDSAPESEVDLAKLHAEYREANEARRAFGERESELERALDGNSRLASKIVALEHELGRLNKLLGERLEWSNAESAELERLRPTLPDVEAITERTLTIQATNDAVRANRERAGVEAELAELQNQSAGFTDAIECIDAAKATALQEARFPVAGLGFDDDGVTLNGLPLSQASHAERLRVSTAIGLELHPLLRVLLVRDGEKLDSDGMLLLAQLADQYDAQLWVERAGHSDAGAVVFEDGEVVQ